MNKNQTVVTNGKDISVSKDDLSYLNYGGRIGLIFNGVAWEYEKDKPSLSMSKIVNDIKELISIVEKDFTRERVDGDIIDPQTGMAYTLEEYFKILNHYKDNAYNLVKDITVDTYKEFISDEVKLYLLEENTTFLMDKMNYVYSSRGSNQYWTDSYIRINWGELYKRLPFVLRVIYRMYADNKGKGEDLTSVPVCKYLFLF